AGSRSARSISARLSMWSRSSTRPSMGRGPDEPVFVLAPAAGDCHRAARLVDSSHGGSRPDVPDDLPLHAAGRVAGIVLDGCRDALPAVRPTTRWDVHLGLAQPTTASR